MGMSVRYPSLPFDMFSRSKSGIGAGNPDLFVFGVLSIWRSDKPRHLLGKSEDRYLAFMASSGQSDEARSLTVLPQDKSFGLKTPEMIGPTRTFPAMISPRDNLRGGGCETCLNDMSVADHAEW